MIKIRFLNKAFKIELRNRIIIEVSKDFPTDTHRVN